MEQREDRRCDNKPVDAVEQTAMSGDEMAAVLHIEVSLEPDFERSPAWLTTARAAASSAANPGRAAPKATRHAGAEQAALTMPPIRPAQVFFGLMRGASFGPPMVLPAA